MPAATVIGRLSSSQPPFSGFHASTVSLNSSGNAASSATYAHGLGAVPDFVWTHQATAAANSNSPLQISAQWDANNVTLLNFGGGGCAQVNVLTGLIWTPVR
jgi:hypothetical protein